ncbi:hypothetical protein BJX70DRAFT_398124 [Aspergillus crustosus]
MWRHTKIQLKANFGSIRGGRRRYMVAITDGQLQTVGGKEIRALVECKQAQRPPDSSVVDRQEAALLLAWIREYPRSPFRHVLVSQDSMHIYITFADHPMDWRSYLIRNTLNPLSFMRLRRYGPWDLQVAEHVMEVAAILLAIGL